MEWEEWAEWEDFKSMNGTSLEKPWFTYLVNLLCLETFKCHHGCHALDVRIIVGL